MLAFRAFCHALSSALGSKYTGLSKDSVSDSFMLLENHVTALRQHRIPLRKGWEYVKLTQHFSQMLPGLGSETKKCPTKNPKNF